MSDGQKERQKIEQIDAMKQSNEINFAINFILIGKTSVKIKKNLRHHQNKVWNFFMTFHAVQNVITFLLVLNVRAQ